jgi:hypothetical protein
MIPRAHSRAPTVKPDKVAKVMTTAGNDLSRRVGFSKFAVGQDAMTDAGGWMPPGINEFFFFFALANETRTLLELL